MAKKPVKKVKVKDVDTRKSPKGGRVGVKY